MPTSIELYTTIFGASQMASASSCWGAPCHNPGKMDGVNLATRMTAYTTLRPMVTPGTPATSKLVRSLESTTAGKRMPPGRKALDAVMIAKVKAWIVAGAMND